LNSTVTEVAPDVHRISTFHPDYGIQFNQFVVTDDEPFLMHTGFRRSFETTLEAVRTLLDPARLRWIGYSHFEPDECGALNEWLARAPHAQPVCGTVGALVMLGDYADRAPRVLADGEVFSTGRRRLRYLSTPHLPHGWDAGLFFEETERTLFCSDLFFHPGDPEPLTESDVVGRARQAILDGMKGPLANDVPWTAHTDPMLRRLAALEPRTLALMHGSTFLGDGRRALLELARVMRETLGERP
jgi:flavorubredoxin